ncbi:hypothetical protein SAMN05421548_12952 [Paraburkholderia lycopersici]|uniref:Uncharacterized protein n=1 Tax=Paraburkholderia lycopersici TaxID=416944 RepID=A0A1G6Z246_9BURK|nr:hypothetical protein SAMN05421548_12952 [Paraburkholderia lycopersici]
MCNLSRLGRCKRRRNRFLSAFFIAARSVTVVAPASASQRLVKPRIEHVRVPQHPGTDVGRGRHTPPGNKILYRANRYAEYGGDVLLAEGRKGGGVHLACAVESVTDSEATAIYITATLTRSATHLPYDHPKPALCSAIGIQLYRWVPARRIGAVPQSAAVNVGKRRAWTPPDNAITLKKWLPRPPSRHLIWRPSEGP